MKTKQIKNFHNIFLLGLAVSIGLSCEEVIELDLDKVEPRMVVEANLSNQPGPYMIHLAETTDFYDENNFNARTGAEVIVYDELGNRDTLWEVNPGYYQTSTIQGMPGIQYTVEINHQGTSYTASSRIPDQVNPLDSLIVSYEEESIFRDEGYYAAVTTQDPGGVDNYYRLKIFVNDEVYIFNQDDEDGDEFQDDNLYLANDKYTDGQYIDFELAPKLNLGDKVKVELYHINKASYDYYRTLLDAIGTGGLAPANPISNFGEQALGNFNAYVVYSDSTVVR